MSSTGRKIARFFRRDKTVKSLTQADFADLRSNWAHGIGWIRLRNEIIRARGIFNYGAESELIEKIPKYGILFDIPKNKAIRIAKAGKEMKFFEPTEVLSFLEIAGIHIKAMILL